MSMPHNPLPPYPPSGPYPPPPAKKGIPVWLWLVFGFAGLCFIGLGLIAVASWYFVGKVKEAGNNPVAAIVRLAAAANPDIEVLDVNERTGKVTVRDKKTGRTATIDATSFGKDGKIEVQSDDGRVQLGGGSSFRPPAWVILPSGARITGGMSAESDGGNGGTVLFTSDASVGELKAGLEEAYRAAGYEVKHTMSVSGTGAEGVQMIFENLGRGRSAAANVGRSADGTGGTLTYSEKGRPREN